MSFCSAGRGIEECDCMCHSPGEGVAVKHIMACCTSCRYCHKHIHFFVLDDHEARCCEQSLRILRSVVVGEDIIDVLWSASESASLMLGDCRLSVQIRVRVMPKADRITELHEALESLGVSRDRVTFTIG